MRLLLLLLLLLFFACVFLCVTGSVLLMNKLICQLFNYLFVWLTVWAASIISPVELVRTKMQSEQLTYKAVAEAIRNTINHNGVLSLWKGLGPTLLRDVPFSGWFPVLQCGVITHTLLHRWWCCFRKGKRSLSL